MPLWLKTHFLVLLVLLFTEYSFFSVTISASSISPELSVSDQISLTGTFENLSPKDIDKMKIIAICESGMEQYNQDGSVLHGIINSDDIGALQINSYYHLDTSKKLGDDIYTTEGNIHYGVLLYKWSGDKPWKASKKCQDEKIS